MARKRGTSDTARRAPNTKRREGLARLEELTVTGDRWFRRERRKAENKLRHDWGLEPGVWDRFDLFVTETIGFQPGVEIRLQIDPDRLSVLWDKVGSPFNMGLDEEEKWVLVRTANACRVAVKSNDPLERERLAHAIEREHLRIERIALDREKIGVRQQRQRSGRLGRGRRAATTRFVCRCVQDGDVRSWDDFVALVSDENRTDEVLWLAPSLSMEIALNSAQDRAIFTLNPGSEHPTKKSLSKKTIQNRISEFRNKSA